MDMYLHAGMADDPGGQYQTPELLDPRIDAKHRSYMSAVRGSSLSTFRARVPMSTMPIHRRWLPRYLFAYM